MSVVEVRHLSLSRGGSPVLRDVSLAIEKGEVFMLIGPSGSGKSSLLRCLNRLEEPPPGSVFFNGTDITTRPVTEICCRVGMVFQQAAMFPGTVGDNVAYGPAMRGETLPPERVRELLDMVALDDPGIAEKSAAELSGGQAQRVTIARALANDPAVLLLDEPTSALDPIATRAIEETLLGLRDRIGLTLVWVSHLVDQARRVGDRVLLLNEGRVVRIASAGEMLDPELGDERALAFANGDEAGLNGDQRGSDHGRAE
ncbi:MAG: phosphate ABC transporter ATP-binding protein [Chloroflexi bacterium]|nr:phosphate ABC transporter ATP-binding protein [Chloroflexota bacterium]